MNALIHFLERQFWLHPFRFFAAPYILGVLFLAAVLREKANDVFLFGQVMWAVTILAVYTVSKGLRHG